MSNIISGREILARQLKYGPIIEAELAKAAQEYNKVVEKSIEAAGVELYKLLDSGKIWHDV